MVGQTFLSATAHRLTPQSAFRTPTVGQTFLSATAHRGTPLSALRIPHSAICNCHSAIQHPVGQTFLSAAPSGLNLQLKIPKCVEKFPTRRHNPSRPNPFRQIGFVPQKKHSLFATETPYLPRPQPLPSFPHARTDARTDARTPCPDLCVLYVLYVLCSHPSYAPLPTSAWQTPVPLPRPSPRLLAQLYHTPAPCQALSPIIVAQIPSLHPPASVA